MEIEQPDRTFDLPQYLAVIRSRKWWIGTFVLLGIFAALSYSFRQTPVYSAQAELIIRQNPQTGYYPAAEDEAQVVTSAQVAELVIEQLGLDMKPENLLGGASAEPLSRTSNVILITYSSEDPEFARDAANQFGEKYIEYQRLKQNEAITSQERDIETNLRDVRGQIETVSRKLEDARRRGDDAEVASLEAQKSALSGRIALLLQQLDQLRPSIQGGVVGELLKPAVTPSTPTSPNHSENAVLGAVGGLLIGIAIAFLRERLDDRFRGRPDVERALESPVLATVPRFTSGRKSAHEIPVVADPRGAASEAYRNLRTGLQFIVAQRGVKSVLVTSPSAHEGKTSTVANLAIVLSQTGRSVGLVSADLRRPTLEGLFGVKADAGLSTWLLGEEAHIENLLLAHPDIPGLHLLPAGPVPSNPAELLTSPLLGQLIQRLESAFDIVLFDSPPVLPVADAVILGSQIEAVVLILDAASTRRSAARHAKEQLERVGASVVGCVLNAFDPASTPYYYEPYYYSQYYSRVSEDDGPQEDERSTQRMLRAIGERRE